MKLSSTSPTVITKDDEDFTSKEKIVLLENGYVEPLTLDDSKSELIGMWEGSFTMKNAKNGSQQVNESFFIHGIAGTGGAENNKLFELPSEPVSSLFKYVSSTSQSSSISSEMLPVGTEDSVGVEHEDTPDHKDLRNSSVNDEKLKLENMDIPSRLIHLVGFGRNKYGRFSMYAVYDESLKLMRCEKKYVTSKYKGLKRGRKPLSYHASNSHETDEHHRMTTRPRTLVESSKKQALNVDYSRIYEFVVPSKTKRPSNNPNDFRVLKNPTNRLSRLVTSPPGRIPRSDELTVKSDFNDEVRIADDIDPTYRRIFFDENSGNIYEGGWMDGKRDGKGICLFADGLIYEGSWIGGVEMGFGQLLTTERRLIYSGEWMDGLMHGHGTYFHANGDKYVGDWKEGVRQGRGDYSWANGCKYVGEWKENLRHGKGVFTWNDDYSFYDGDWFNDMRHGKGLLIAQGGFRYDGYWHQNFFEGKGVSVFLDGQEYQGSFKQGLREGRGSIRFSVGGEYEGRFKEDHMDGQGTIKLLHTVPGMGEEHMIPIQIQADIKRIHYRAGFVDDLH